MKNKHKIRVRFAPSPTGFLHIGSARTALFNWLFARKNKGEFVLRIEDTDISRHQEEAVGLILSSLKWLGLNWDEGPDIGGNFGPYRQSQRNKIYSELAQKLVDQGKAYYCFCTPEELGAERDKAQKMGGAFKYDRRCHKLSTKDIENNLKNNIPFTIRLLVPDNEIITFNDNVYGEIKVNSANIEDFIIIRSNGLPTYNYSVAVDDVLMEITNVIRGEDHLSNTPKQLLVYEALGYNIPEFTHLPMILGPDGTKLSKRHGSISIESYREQGFLSEAIINFLALLGWAYDEKTTIFSIDELISKFSLDSINKKPAKFDYDKLLWINGYHIRNFSDDKLTGLIYESITEFLSSQDPSEIEEGIEPTRETIRKILPLIKERIRTIGECPEMISPYFLKIKYDSALIHYFDAKEINASQIINRVLESFGSIDENNFNSVQVEQKLRAVSEETHLNFRKLAEVIRIAVWAKKVSPPLFGTMEILGKQTTLKRLAGYKHLISAQ